MASFDVFDSFLIIKTSQEWGRTWYNPWQSKIEAKLHGESKFWRASKPLPNQSSVQGRESKESNTKNFATPCKIFARQKEISQPLFTLAKSSQARRKFLNFFSALQNFHNSISDLRNLHVIFKYFAPTSLDFYLKIFCVIIYSLLVISWRSF